MNYHFACHDCGREYHPASLPWCCECGGILDVAGFTPEFGSDFTSSVDTPTWSQWRYRVQPVDGAPVSLGEGMTPLVAAPGHAATLLKCDYLMPTGSFKDRGATVVATAAAELGVREAIIDSSGNAGTAMAAYFASRGLPLKVFVPGATSPNKLKQLHAYGAEVVLVDGDRTATAGAALAEADREGVYFASHVYNPLFHHGVKTYVYELFEQLGGVLPAAIVVPVGNGTMVLGAWLAIHELHRAGFIAQLPQIIAVQTDTCAPIAAALRGQEADLSHAAKSVAEGIAIVRAPRQEQIVEAIRSTGGTILTVPDANVLAARDELAAQGFFVEPTSSVCFSALDQVRARVPEGLVIAPLCGTGLKTVK